MGEHYFSEKPNAAHDTQWFALPFAGRTLRFQTDAGVFSKGRLDKGTALLLESLPETLEGLALDLGCGWGAVGACMTVLWPQAKIIMTDINERAAALARDNLRDNGLEAEVAQGDGLAHLEGPFSLIATNPPIRTGKAVIYDLFAQSAAKLAPEGALHIVIRKQQGADSAAKYLRTLFSRVDTVARGGGYHVLRCTGPHMPSSHG